MRLDKVFIDGFKNLKQVTVHFDKKRLTTVIIGQNGAGKSNLIEAITNVFRWVDLRKAEPKYRYQISYQIGNSQVCLSNLPDEAAISVNGKEIKRTEFEKRKTEWFPDLIFGYYSGGSRRLEALFDGHQRRYYESIIKVQNDDSACAAALKERRLFYCRPIHGVMALMAYFCFPDEKVSAELNGKLGITAFHSMLCHFREPWFAKGGKQAKIDHASDFWGATGPAGRCGKQLQGAAMHPIALDGNSLDDYRDKQQIEAQYATFLPAMASLKQFASNFKTDQEMFFALEAMDISDLIKEFYLWVTRVNDDTGDVAFADLSDGERQLLMALGLIRISRGKRALFLLDEPDTHLNPHWQHSYLNLIQEWTGIAADANDCHIILTSHNPLTISALTRDEVRVMATEPDGSVSVSPPYTDPRGMGFTATLTEIFGLPTTLDSATQHMVDDRNVLAQIDQRTDDQGKKLIEINDKLNQLGFMFESREPLYQDFLHAWHDVRYADRKPMTPAQIEARHHAMKALIAQLQAKGEPN